MRSPNRTHERSTFFKYMPLSTAKAVLENCSLRWSSPIIFNDPFDVPREVMPGLDEISMSKALMRKVVMELANPRKNIDDLNPRIRAMLLAYGKSYPQGVPSEHIELLRKDIDNPPIGAGAVSAVREMKSMWKAILNARRILCLSENPTIPPMWNHYADGYKGIVIEYDCIDALESTLLLAKPITYTNDMPLTNTAEGMAELLLLPDSEAIKYIVDVLPFMKTTDWSYEKEWRVSHYAKTDSQGHFSDLKFHPLEVKSIILGPLFDEGEANQILALAKNYPQARIYQSSFGADRKISISPRC